MEDWRFSVILLREVLGSSRICFEGTRARVLTAGKADETVADCGGPRPDHSIFTGHLLDALEGNAADGSGVISANAVMVYVYDHVGKDPHSRQSPHFGFLDGDGDFIFIRPES